MKLRNVIHGLFVLILLSNCNDSTKDTLTENSIDVNWEIEEIDDRHRVSFYIRNTSDVVLSSTNWKLYFNQITGAENNSLSPAGARIEHISGYFFALAPTKDFEDLAPDDSIVF